MRKLILIFIAGQISCTSTEREDEKATAINEMQEKVDKIITQVRADCDSNILRVAQYKADSTRQSKNKKRRR